MTFSEIKSKIKKCQLSLVEVCDWLPGPRRERMERILKELTLLLHSIEDSLIEKQRNEERDSCPHPMRIKKQ